MSVAASGLFECLSHALSSLGTSAIDAEHCTKLVGFGTDGASSKYCKRGLERIYWMWCLAQRLELAVKDSLKGTAFDSINDMLLKLY